MTVRTRFAPSPTGDLHIGGARTALFCWLYARHTGGQFVLRIEDTDRERSTQESIDVILESIGWLGLDYDEGPIYQSDRLDRYRELVDELLAAGQAYHCYCSKDELDAQRAAQTARGDKPRYDRRCRQRSGPPPARVKPVVRFKTPLDGIVHFADLVRGRVGISNDELDDLVILRSDGVPTYNFSVVVDDSDMAITHVIRGDDHVNNTPRQINIFRALNAPLPVFAHVPMILGADGQRLSKRHGAVSVLAYRDEGFLPEGLLNYLVRLGWSHGDQEIFSLEEMVELFDVADVNKAPATFDPDKLGWVNQHYIKQADGAHLAALLTGQLEASELDVAGGPTPMLVVEALRERARTMVEMAERAGCYYTDDIVYEDAAARKHLRPVAGELLAATRIDLGNLADWRPEAIHEVVETVAERHDVKLGKVAQPIRVAVTGSAASPPIDVTLHLVGQGRALKRLDAAVAYIDERAANSS